MADDRRPFGDEPLDDIDVDLDVDVDVDVDEQTADLEWSTTPNDPTEAVRIISSSDDPPLRFGAQDTGPMPHWTEPPTGEMPSLFGDPPTASTSWTDELDEDDADWQPFADRTSSTPVPTVSDLADPSAPKVALTFDAEADAADLPAAAAAAVTEPRITPIRTKRPARPAPPLRRDEPSAARRGPSGRNLPVAIGVGVAIAALYLLLSKFGPRFLVGLVVVILGLAVAELYESQRKAGYQPATFVGIAATIGMPLVAYWRGAEGLPVVLFVAIVATALWLLLSGTLDSAPMPNMSATLLGVVYVGLLGSYAALILRQPHGVSAMFTVALCTVGYDVIGLLAGSAVGRSPLIRWVSPNKTVEGLLAGMAAAVGLALLSNVGHVAPWNDRTIHIIQLGVVIAIAAPVGDLVESMLKRSLGVKDMGDLLPGHGGVLDRFDAFLFVLPAVYYLGQVLNVPQLR